MSGDWVGSREDLSDFLSNRPNIHKETVSFLFEQEVDVDSFCEFTEDSVLKHFPTLTFGQRKALVVLSSALRAEVDKLKPIFFPNDNSCPPTCLKIAAETLQENSGFLQKNVSAVDNCEDLGCQPLPKDDDKFVAGGLMHSTTPSMSSSFSIKKPNPSSLSSANRHPIKKAKIDNAAKDGSDVEPMDILGVLDSERGQKLISHVREFKALSNSDQIYLMDRIYQSVVKDQHSPFKNYPETNVKIAIAKGIVKAFPELKCDGENEWSAWFTVTVTKFESVRRKSGQRKNNNLVSSSASGSQNTSKKKKSSLSSTVTSSAVCSTVEKTSTVELSTSEENSDDGRAILNDSLKRYMDGALPNSQNRQQISSSLASTFEARRSLIHNSETTPSCAAIVREYKHLQSYNGDMIMEEFSRMEPLAENLVEKFEKLSPHIVKHAKVLKPSLHTEVSDKFGHNVNLVALLLLPRLLPTAVNLKTVTSHELAHLKKYKITFEQIPSSSFLQIVPEGTDVTTHTSLESSKGREQPTPVFPYLLWLTNDYKSGQLFLKIDNVSFLVGTFPCDNDPIIRAVDKLHKAYFVFNLNYHPYLHTVFNFFEVLSGICTKPRNTVEKFHNTLRELAKNKERLVLWSQRLCAHILQLTNCNSSTSCS